MRLRQFPEQDQFIELTRSANVIPVGLEILADMDTPVTIMRKIYSNQGPAFLFESVEGGERWGRFSFLGTASRSQIKIFKDIVEIEQNGSTRRVSHDGDPMGYLRTYMAQFQPAVIPELPRFWGGLVGYLTYEAVSFFEKIPNDLPINSPLAYFMIPEEILIFDNISNTLMVVALCFTEDYPDGASAYAAALERIESLAARIEKPIAKERPHSRRASCQLEPVIDEEAFRQKVLKTKEYIRAGDIIQAVISQLFTCNSTPDPLGLYRAQRYINPSPYLFFLHLEETVLIGSSPETMVRLENGVATLRPIAGTRPRGSTEQKDRDFADELLKDEKERAEHLMLVDLGRNDLGRVAETGTVQVTDLMVVERYSHVMHLVSNICCDLRSDCDAWSLIPAAFPTGTLSGAPKVRAMEIIAELEEEARGPYGGAVGYISFNGNMDMAITIRTACVENGQLTVRAGAGIVADSNPERERMETVNKAMAIQKALELLNGESLNDRRQQ
jgi:anthranilate synthase component 1